MGKFTNTYQKKTYKSLFTASLITLTLLNVQSVHAEEPTETEIEVVVEEEVINASQELLETMIAKFELELTEEQYYWALETLQSHEIEDFERATELYEEFTEIGLRIDIDELIELFNEEELNADSLKQSQVSEAKETKQPEQPEQEVDADEETEIDELKSVESESVESESVESEAEEKEPAQGSSMMASLSADIEVPTAEELYDAIINARTVSGAWNLTNQFISEYSDDHRLEAVVNHTAQINLDYAMRLHSDGDYTNAIFYYNRIINAENVSSQLKAEATVYSQQASTSDNLKTADNYYEEILTSGSVSKAWNLAIEFNQSFQNDVRLTSAMNHAATLNLNYGMRLHGRGEHVNSLQYYNRVIEGPKISSVLKREAEVYRNQANEENSLQTATDYYNDIMNAASVSNAWTTANRFLSDFPNDNRLETAINHAAELQMNYAKKLHNQKDFQNSLQYYKRILDTNVVSDTLKAEARAYHRQANNHMELTTASEYYNSIVNAKSVSTAWTLAEQYLIDFPNDNHLEEAINNAAQLNVNYAERLHARNDYQTAIIYYDRVLNANRVSASLKDEIQVYKNQANDRRALMTADNYYNDIRNAKSVSTAWNLAEQYLIDYPNDKHLGEAINIAARLNANYAEKLHARNDYQTAIIYYDRVLNTDKVSASLKDEIQVYRNQANENRSLMTANNYYDEIKNTGSVSIAWSLGQRFKTDYPNNNQLTEAVNYAAELNLNYATRIHQDERFSESISYYNRIVDETLVTSSLRSKAEVYSYLAENNLFITETVLNISKYDQTLEEVIDIQMAVKAKPQISKPGGGFKNASREEVAHYVNSENFTHDKSADSITTALSTLEITTGVLNVRTGPSTAYRIIGSVKRGEKYTIVDVQNGWYKIGKDNKTGWISGYQGYVTKEDEILQFLDLSRPMGIPGSELNAYLEGKGILTGTGAAFSEASNSAKVNELYLISHALLETGHGTSALATGIRVDEVNGQKVAPRVVYNMFGIGAYDSDPEKFGSERAYTEGWFSPEAAIIGGAKWVSENYIHHPLYRQNTLYEMRWNPHNPGVHQYATDVAWAVKQTNQILNEAMILAQRHNLVMIFDIPQYK